MAGFMASCFVLAAGLGLQAGRNVIRVDEVEAELVRAGSIVVQTQRGGEVRIDQAGITISAAGLPVRTTHLTEHEARIEIGMDYDWSQDSGLRPTPRVAVGRAGRDASNNLVTRAAIVSPEGVHSGEWHTNNPRHDGRTDRDLIEDLKRGK